jgi:hypothetical protein
MTFLRSVKECTKLDRFRNENIRKGWHVYLVTDKMALYKHNWVDHISRVNEARWPDVVLQLKLDGRSVG